MTLQDMTPQTATTTTATVYARVTLDGYILWASTEDGDLEWPDKYWPPNATEFGPLAGLRTITFYKVPSELANNLCQQGTEDQFYDDGYCAWLAVLPYYVYVAQPNQGE